MKKDFRIVLVCSLIFLAGVIVGGYLFSDTQPRSVLAFKKCNNCLKINDLLGLLGSVGIHRAPGLIPAVILETDKTLAINQSVPGAGYHFVIIPKKDIKNIGELAEGDQAYVIDCYTVAGELIRKYKLKKYRMWTNGPKNQIVTYLHFHLAGT